MKQSITLLLFLLSVYSTGTVAQCKKEYDEFKKTTTIRSSTEKIGKTGFPPYFIESKVINVNGAYYILLISQFRDIQTIQKGEKAFIKLTTNEILEFDVDETSISEYKSGEAFSQGTSTTVWYNYLFLDLNDENLAMLRSNPIAKINIHSYTYEVKSKNSKVIIEQIACVEATK